MTNAVTPPLDPRAVSLLWALPDRTAELAAMHATLFEPPWSEKSIGALLDHPAVLAMTAETGKPRELLGFIVVQHAADEAEILTLGVAKGWQRRGVAQMLIEGMLRAVAKAGAGHLFLEVAADNEAAIALYRKMKFNEIGRRSAYYSRPNGPPVDALMLARSV